MKTLATALQKVPFGVQKARILRAFRASAGLSRKARILRALRASACLRTNHRILRCFLMENKSFSFFKAGKGTCSTSFSRLRFVCAKTTYFTCFASLCLAFAEITSFTCFSRLCLTFAATTCFILLFHQTRGRWRHCAGPSVQLP